MHIEGLRGVQADFPVVLLACAGIGQSLVGACDLLEPFLPAVTPRELVKALYSLYSVLSHVLVQALYSVAFSCPPLPSCQGLTHQDR